MEISPYMLSLLLVYSLAFGISGGVLNDINRIVRIALGMRSTGVGAKKHGAKKIYSLFSIFLIAVQDVLLFTYMGVGVVILNYYLNRGIFRIYSIAAAAVGFALYYFTLGRVVMFFSERVIGALKIALCFALRIATAPIRFALRILYRIAKKLYRKIRFAIAKRKIMRYNKIKREELMAEARHGFVADGAAWKGAK